MENNIEKDLKEKLNRLSFTKKKLRKPEVSYPVPLQKETASPLLLLAFHHKSSNYYNIVDYKSPEDNSNFRFSIFQEKDTKEYGLFFTESSINTIRIEGKSIVELMKAGEITNEASKALLKDTVINPENYIIGLRIDKEILFYQVLQGKITACNTDAYSLTLDVFSRNTGLIESAMMKDKTAIISGCGSVGSYVALELARSGVGNFVLIDGDTVSYANVCRHQCNISDVGRYKTEAVADRVKLINPQANVHTENLMIENVPPDVFQKHAGPDSIIIGCADNRQGDIFANKIATHANMPIVSIGFWERAFAGEIFFWYPENKDLACYHCFTDALGDLSGRTSTNRRYYTTEEDLSKVNFMPGVSVDITFITNIGVKIILDILNRNDKKFVPRLIDSLEQFTLIANTNKKEIGGDQASIFSYPLQVTTSIEVTKDKECPYCGNLKQ